MREPDSGTPRTNTSLIPVHLSYQSTSHPSPPLILVHLSYQSTSHTRGLEGEGAALQFGRVHRTFGVPFLCSRFGCGEVQRLTSPVWAGLLLLRLCVRLFHCHLSMYKGCPLELTWSGCEMAPFVVLSMVT